MQTICTDFKLFATIYRIILTLTISRYWQRNCKSNAASVFVLLFWQRDNLHVSNYINNTLLACIDCVCNIEAPFESSTFHPIGGLLFVNRIDDIQNTRHPWIYFSRLTLTRHAQTCMCVCCVYVSVYNTTYHIIYKRPCVNSFRAITASQCQLIVFASVVKVCPPNTQLHTRRLSPFMEVLMQIYPKPQTFNSTATNSESKFYTTQ